VALDRPSVNELLPALLFPATSSPLAPGKGGDDDDNDDDNDGDDDNVVLRPASPLLAPRYGYDRYHPPMDWRLCFFASIRFLPSVSLASRRRHLGCLIHASFDAKRTNIHPDGKYSSPGLPLAWRGWN